MSYCSCVMRTKHGRLEFQVPIAGTRRDGERPWFRHQTHNTAEIGNHGHWEPDEESHKNPI